MKSPSRVCRSWNGGTVTTAGIILVADKVTVTMKRSASRYARILKGGRRLDRQRSPVRDSGGVKVAAPSPGRAIDAGLKIADKVTVTMKRSATRQIVGDRQVAIVVA
jgi:hypothetical protein